jgi:hypothetical protein
MRMKIETLDYKYILIHYSYLIGFKIYYDDFYIFFRPIRGGSQLFKLDCDKDKF